MTGENNVTVNESNNYVNVQAVNPNNVYVEDTHNLVTVDPENPNYVVVRSAVTLAGKTRRHIHRQIEASATWTLTHPLGGFPIVAVVDSAKNVVIGDVRYIDTETIELTFSGAFSGSAYLT